MKGHQKFLEKPIRAPLEISSIVLEIKRFDHGWLLATVHKKSPANLQSLLIPQKIVTVSLY